MPRYFSVEELVINDSFLNYCFQKNEADILYWKQYISDYPSEIENVEEAKEMVLSLHIMLKQEYEKNAIIRNFADERNPAPAKTLVIKKILRYAAAVAAVFLVVLLGKKAMDLYLRAPKSTKGIVVNAAPSDLFLFRTSKGEKKTIILSDNTKLYLNAGSEFRVDEAYGKENRKVYLTGEALFDVTHNESLPFIVHTDKYDVKVLGTLFNIRAYPGDRQRETSLIRGKVEIQMNNSSRRIMLSPSQKLVTNHNDDLKADDSGAKEAGKLSVPVEKEAILPLSYDGKDHAVVETAWAQNRLEIVSENFLEMKEKLERWYNVKISFTDADVTKYTFSATFEGETIEQVLKALQNAYPFNYQITDKDITISK